MSHSIKNTDTNLLDQVRREAKKKHINLSQEQEKKAVTMLAQLSKAPSDYILSNIVRTVASRNNTSV